MQQNTGSTLDPSAVPPVVGTLDRLARPRSRGWLLASLLMLGALLIAVLFTPPVSMGDRIAELSYDRLSPDGGGVTMADGTTLLVDQGAVTEATPLKMAIVPLADFILNPPAALKTATELPQRLTLKSAVYTFDTRGQDVNGGKLSMLIPTDVKDSEFSVLDIYSWDGDRKSVV